MGESNPFLIFILRLINIETWYFPAMNNAWSLSNDLIIPPSIFLFLLDLAKPTEQFVVSDHKRILHVGPTEFSLIVVNTSQEQMGFHVQRRKIVDMDNFLVPVLKFIFLSVSTNVFDKCLQHYVQDLFDLSTWWLCVFRKVHFSSA